MPASPLRQWAGVLYIAFLAILLVGESRAQSVSVVDRVAGQPLEGATFHHARSGTFAVTDAKGRVDIHAFRGLDSIVVRMLAYETLIWSYEALSKLTAPLALIRSPFAFQEVIISAARWEQESQRIPDRITVVSPRDVSFANPGTAADMLQQTGEVFMQRSQLGGGSPMVRGFAAIRLLIVVDGVRMNNAIYRSGNLQNIISADPYSLERAEVLHGPGAMTYGSDAIGGVIDIHLLRPRFSSDSTLLARGGAMLRYATAANELAGHVDIGLGGRKLAFVASATVTRFNDLRMGANGPDDYLRPWYVRTIDGLDSQVVNVDPQVQRTSGYTNMNFLGKLAYRPTKALEVAAHLHFSTTSDVPRYDRLIETRNGAPRSAEWYYGPQRWLMTSLQLRHNARSGPWSKARMTLALQNYTESRNDRNFRSASLRTQTEVVEGIGINLDLEKELNARTQLFYGAEWVNNTVGSKGVRVDQVSGVQQVINSRYPDGSRWAMASAYLGVLHDLSERITLSGGGRFNWSALDCFFDTTLFPYPATRTTLANSAFTGNLGMAFRPGTGWKLGLDLSSGFRAPNIDDIGKVFDSEAGAVIVPNPDLSAEYAYSAEVGIEKVVQERLRLTGTAYHSLLDNAMVRRPFTLDGRDTIAYDGEPSRVDAIQNAAEARVFGFLFGVDAAVGRSFGLTLRYSWQQGVEQDDANTGDVPLRHAPPPFGQASVSWTRERLRVELSTQYSAGFDHDELPPSEQAKAPLYALDGNGDPYSPGWYTVGLRGSFQLNRTLQITGGVENLSDQRYRPYSSGITAPGRNWVIALRARF
ncbi:MAG: TonB-dependent receptor [Flavobacteriales bacterium]|nr:TonB-dependent receptor [Flavobacteriales bacterium]